MNIIKDFIPEGSKNRPMTGNTKKYITIHDTANKEFGANAASHAEYIKTIEDLTSWHYTVDENGAYTLYEYHQSIRNYYNSAADAAKPSCIAISRAVVLVIFYTSELLFKSNAGNMNIDVGLLDGGDISDVQ